MPKFKKVDDLLRNVCYDEEVVNTYPRMSDAQAGYIEDLITHLGLEESDVVNAVFDEFGTKRSIVEELSVEEASWMIDQMKEERHSREGWGR